jgi:hypothetical protein
MNYTNLVRDIKRFMEDDGTEFSDAIDTFIDITELKLSRELKIPAFRRRATSTLTANDPFISMPADMVSLENLHLIESNSRTLLLLRSDEFMMEYWPDRTATGSPRYYSYFDDDTMYVAPTPGSNISVEISYRRRLPALSSSNLTNWLTDNASDALLYGCLVEAAAFNRNYALQERYMAMYQKAVQDITQEQQVRNSIDNMYQRNEG